MLCIGIENQISVGVGVAGAIRVPKRIRIFGRLVDDPQPGVVDIKQADAFAQITPLRFNQQPTIF